MRVGWTTLADDDLSRIVRRIRQDKPAAARKVAKTLYDSAMSLETMPDRGRSGRIAGTREFDRALHSRLPRQSGCCRNPADLSPRSGLAIGAPIAVISAGLQFPMTGSSGIP
jgi:plasmid stabilization system protein ParE